MTNKSIIDDISRWQGSNENETGVDRESGRTLVKVNQKFYHPAEVELLFGNSEKVRQILGRHTKIDFKPLCRMMMEADIAHARNTFLDVKDN